MSNIEEEIGRELSRVEEQEESKHMDWLLARKVGSGFNSRSSLDEDVS